MGGDRLAIGVCTFNRGPKLLDTLATLAALDTAGGRVTRVVVVDNNCTDGTAQRVREFARTAAGIPVQVVAEPEQGLSAARRRVLIETDEPLVAFVDDDCLVDTAWASACLACFDRAPRVGAAGGRVTLRWEQRPSRLACACATQLAQQDHGLAARRLDGDREFLVGAAIVLRRSAVEQTGWLARAVMSDRTGASLVSGGDTELCVRLRAAGWDLWYEPAARVEHLIPPSRQRREYLARLLRGIGRSEPFVEWMRAGRPGPEWLEARTLRAVTAFRRTCLFEWRPRRRFLRLHQRAGRLDGWRELAGLLRSGEAPRFAAQPGEPVSGPVVGGEGGGMDSPRG